MLHRASNPELQKLVAKYRLIYSIVGLVLGFICIILGSLLVLSGVAGNSNWTASFIGMESILTDASPGIILFVVGLFVVRATKFKFRHV